MCRFLGTLISTEQLLLLKPINKEVFIDWSSCFNLKGSTNLKADLVYLIEKK